MEPVVIGIHGLRNKPSKYVLTSWWKQAIAEGFRMSGLRVPRYRFELAYWAYYMHDRAQQAEIGNPDDSRFLSEPYVPCSTRVPPHVDGFAEKFTSGIHRQLVAIVAGKHGFMNIDSISDIILHRMFVELEIYYHQNLRDPSGSLAPACGLIRGELARLIEKYRRRDIMIVAHSMGAIIAYDTLLHVVPDIAIRTLVTMGAPLGFAPVRNQILRELGMGRSNSGQLPTPPNIRRAWLNLSDIEDTTCLNYDLHNHYRENAYGVRPMDQIVSNNYEYRGRRNPHKAYGYLRTPQVADTLHHFLCLEHASVWKRMAWVLRKPAF